MSFYSYWSEKGGMRMLQWRALGVGLVGLCSSLAVVLAQPADPPRRLQVEDLFAIQRVDEPQISPEGDWVAYTISQTDLKEEKSETAIWMTPAAGGEAIRMTGAGSSADRPRWSPDGKYLTFQASRGESSKSQVWALNRQGGEAQQLTKVKQGIQSYDWSPDGTRLLLVIRDPEPDADSDEADEKEDDQKGKEKKPKPWVIDRLQFKRDRVGYLDRRRAHLYLFDIQGGDLTQLTSGDYDHSQPVWSPDGKQIAFVSNRTEEPDSNDNTDIWLMEVDRPEQAPRQLTTNAGADSRPAWSADGRLIAYVTVVRPEIIWYATSHLAVIEAAGGTPTVLTAALDRNVSSPLFGRDGHIYFRLEDSGEEHLARIDPSGGDLQLVVSGSVAISSFDLGPSGEVALLLSRSHLPNEIFVHHEGSERQLTHTNEGWLSQVTLAPVKNIHFNSSDGTPVEGFLYTPPDYQSGVAYPTLLWIHGGPVAQYDVGFDFQPQLFAAQGYVVLQVNPRGSSGYGEAFSLGIYRSWGQADFQDVMAGIDYVIEEGYADPERLGVGGWSYGGILTNYVITQTDRFKAAISGASEVLYVANYGHDHYQQEWEAELGLPWENRELWERLSPFNSVQKIVTPTLILCGEKDWNVPVLNSEQLYQALRRLGRTTQLIVYPDEFHGIRRPSFQKDRLERYLEWFGRFLAPSQVATGGGR